MQLPHTKAAIVEAAGPERSYMGEHPGLEMRVAEEGVIAGEEEFDLARHSFADIDPFSLSKIMGGTRLDHFVALRIPDAALPVNVVIHSDPREQHDPTEVLLGRKILISELERSLRGQLPREDRYSFFTAGYVDPYLLDDRATHLRGTEDPLLAAEAIARLCTNSLTLVVSTFRNLPLEQVRSRYRSTVGVKVNHPWDLELPADAGKHDTGDPTKRVVNTDRTLIGKKLPQELIDYRALQAQRHAQTIARLHQAGIRMVSAVFDKQLAPDYTDDKALDRSLARAVRAAAR